MSVHATLDASALRMESGFGGVGQQLSAVRGGLTDLVVRLADLDRVLHGQRAQDRVMDIVADAARGVKDALQVALAAAAPPRVQTAADSAADAVAVIESQTRMLDAVANLSLITARSLGLDGFEDYVRDLRTLGDEMRRDATRVGTALAALRRRRRRAAELFQHAGAALQEVEDALASHSRARAETARLLSASISGVGAVAERVPGLLQAETGTLIRAMQFADEAAQRIDHIRTILSRPGPSALALAAAQVEALVVATRDTVSDASTSLSRIRVVATDSGRVLSVGDDTPDDPAAAAVALGHSLLTALAQASASAFEAIDGAAGEGAALNDLAAEAGQRFASLADATAAIHVAAINAGLLSGTHRGQERAMNVLSVDVQQQAAICARATDACRAAVSDLTLPDDLAVFAAVSDKALVFRRAVAETAEAISAAGGALAELGDLRLAAGDSLQALTPAVSHAQDALGAIAAAADDLAGVVAGLPRTVPPGAAPLADLLDLYTMESERVVHRRVFGLPQEPEPPRAEGLSADVSSGLTDQDMDPLASILF